MQHLNFLANDVACQKMKNNVGCSATPPCIIVWPAKSARAEKQIPNVKSKNNKKVPLAPSIHSKNIHYFFIISPKPFFCSEVCLLATYIHLP